MASAVRAAAYRRAAWACRGSEAAHPVPADDGCHAAPVGDDERISDQTAAASEAGGTPQR